VTVKKLKFKKIQNGGGHRLEKPKNRYVTPTIRPISTKFDTMMQLDPLEPSNRQNLKFLKNPTLQRPLS